MVHQSCVRTGPGFLIPSDSSPFLLCHNSKSVDQNNMSNLGHPQPQKYIYRCRVFHRASAYSNTSASTPQTPGLCLSLNIYFQRINASGRQVLAPRQKGDIRNSNTGVQTQIFVPLTGFRRQRYLCFRFFLQRLLLWRRDESWYVTWHTSGDCVQCKQHTSGRAHAEQFTPVSQRSRK